jgi:hypothetical protein
MKNRKAWFVMGQLLRSFLERADEVLRRKVMDFGASEDNGFFLVCQALARHRRRFYHSLPYTVNRLFRKHMKTFGDPHRLPVLSDLNTQITYETRPKNVWARYAGKNKSGKFDRGGPIIILRFRGAERLLDGNHRCRLWAETDDPAPHTAIVMTVTQDYA